LLDIEDVSELVREQRANAVAPFERLVTPREEEYSVTGPEVGSRLGLTVEGA
jgi:hypothetical protein